MVVPQYKRPAELRSVDFTTIFLVEHKGHPVFFVEMKSSSELRLMSSQKEAHLQMGERLIRLFEDVAIGTPLYPPLPPLPALPALLFPSSPPYLSCPPPPIPLTLLRPPPALAPLPAPLPFFFIPLFYPFFPFFFISLSPTISVVGTALQIDVPGTALCSAQAIHVQIKGLFKKEKKRNYLQAQFILNIPHFPSF